MLQAWTFSSSFVVFVMMSLKTSIGSLLPRASIVARSLIAGGLSTPFRDASAGVMVLFAVVHLDWLDGAA